MAQSKPMMAKGPALKTPLAKLLKVAPTPAMPKSKLKTVKKKKAAAPNKKQKAPAGYKGKNYGSMEGM